MFTDRIKDLILAFKENKIEWCRGALARDVHDRIVTVESGGACKFDVSGAIFHLFGFGLASTELIYYLERRTPEKILVNWNDHQTSIDDIIKFLESLI